MSEPQSEDGGVQPLRVEVTRSGGFAGVTINGSLDTRELDPAKAAELRRLVERAGVLGHTPPVTAGSPGADRFQYQLTVQEGSDGGSTFTIDEAGASEDLKELLRFLMASIKETRGANTTE